MSNIRFLNVLWLCVLLGLQSVSAKEAKHSFMLTLWDSPASGQSFFYSTSESPKLVKLKVQEMSRSAVYFVDQNEILIHSKEDGAIEKVATVELNPSYHCSLIVLKKKDDGAYDTIVLNDPKSPPYGSYLFYNQSDIEVEGMLGTAAIKLTPHSSALVKPKAKSDEALSYELWHMPENKKKFLQRNTLNYNPKKYLIVLLSSEKTSNGKIRLKSKGLVKFKR